MVSATVSKWVVGLWQGILQQGVHHMPGMSQFGNAASHGQLCVIAGWWQLRHHTILLPACSWKVVCVGICGTHTALAVLQASVLYHNTLWQ